MSIFEKLKKALESDVSFDLKLAIEGEYFDVIIEARDYDDLKNNPNYKGYYDGKEPPSSITVRYCIVSDEVYLPLDELVDGKVLSFTDLHMIQKVMSVLYDSKDDIEKICGGLCGEDREYCSEKPVEEENPLVDYSK